MGCSCLIGLQPARWRRDEARNSKKDVCNVCDVCPALWYSVARVCTDCPRKDLQSPHVSLWPCSSWWMLSSPEIALTAITATGFSDSITALCVSIPSHLLAAAYSSSDLTFGLGEEQAIERCETAGSCSGKASREGISGGCPPAFPLGLFHAY